MENLSNTKKEDSKNVDEKKWAKKLEIAGRMNRLLALGVPIEEIRELRKEWEKEI